MPDISVFLHTVPSDTNRNDVRLRDPLVVFPQQFFGLRYKNGAGVTVDLCLVALIDAPAGNRLTVWKNGVAYAVYPVLTTDLNASSVRLNTTTGIKALRLKT